MGGEVIILSNPYTYNFLKGLTHSALESDCIAISVRVWVRMPTCICITKYANIDA